MITETNPNCSSPLVERISEYDQLISQLKEQIREQTEKKRELERKQRAIDKLVEAAASLELGGDKETIEYLWKSLAAVLPHGPLAKEAIESSEWTERIGSPVKNKRNQYRGRLKAIYLEESIAVVELAENVIGQWPISELELDIQYLTPEKEEEQLIENPVKKNTSNSFYAWQLTSNEAIAFQKIYTPDST